MFLLLFLSRISYYLSSYLTCSAIYYLIVADQGWEKVTCKGFLLEYYIVSELFWLSYGLKCYSAYWYFGKKSRLLIQGKDFSKQRSTVTLKKRIYDCLSNTFKHCCTFFVLLYASRGVLMPRKALNVSIDRMHKGTNNLNK